MCSLASHQYVTRLACAVGTGQARNWNCTIVRAADNKLDVHLRRNKREIGKQFCFTCQSMGVRPSAVVIRDTLLLPMIAINDQLQQQKLALMEQVVQYPTANSPVSTSQIDDQALAEATTTGTPFDVDTFNSKFVEKVDSALPIPSPLFDEFSTRVYAKLMTSRGTSTPMADNASNSACAGGVDDRDEPGLPSCTESVSPTLSRYDTMGQTLHSQASSAVSAISTIDDVDDATIDIEMASLFAQVSASALSESPGRVEIPTQSSVGALQSQVSTSSSQTHDSGSNVSKSRLSKRRRKAKFFS